MFFLLPRVVVVLLVVFATLTAVRAWRQRHGQPRERRRRPPTRRDKPLP